MRLRFLVVILPRESQVHLYVPLDDLRCAKALCDGLPAHLPFFCRRQYGRSQMVRVQPVIARLWGRQAAAWRFGLPHRVGAPQAQLHGCGVEPIGLDHLPLFIGFGHQALFAVDVVGGLCLAALFDCLGNPSAKGVIAVAGFCLGCALARQRLVLLHIPDQPFGCVVFVFFALERVAFLALAAALLVEKPSASPCPPITTLCVCSWHASISRIFCRP